MRHSAQRRGDIHTTHDHLISTVLNMPFRRRIGTGSVTFTEGIYNDSCTLCIIGGVGIYTVPTIHSSQCIQYFIGLDCGGFMEESGMWDRYGMGRGRGRCGCEEAVLKLILEDSISGRIGFWGAESNKISIPPDRLMTREQFSGLVFWDSLLRNL